MLDHPNTTHTSPVVILFRNVHQVLGKVGRPGFDKVPDYLTVKYSSDHIEYSYYWSQQIKNKSVENKGGSNYQSTAITD